MFIRASFNTYCGQVIFPNAILIISLLLLGLDDVGRGGIVGITLP